MHLALCDSGLCSARLDAPVTARIKTTLRSEDVVETHYAYVWRTLLRLGARRVDVEDLTQETFLTVHHRLASYDSARPIRPWLFGIAFNTLRSSRRLSRNKSEELGHDLDSFSQLSADASTEAASVVRAALARVDEERRAVFILYELDDVSVADIAAAFSIPADTVYSRLRKAREEFRGALESLQKEGGR